MMRLVLAATAVIVIVSDGLEWFLQDLLDLNRELMIIGTLGTLIPLTVCVFWAFHQLHVQLREVEAQIQDRAQEQAESVRLRTLREVSATVDHHINNQLMVISGAAELLEQQTLLGEKARSYVQLICQSVEKIKEFNERLGRVTQPAVVEVIPGLRMLDLSASSEM